MKAITKLGLAVILFMATAVFNSVMAQKFEFKSTQYAIMLVKEDGSTDLLTDKEVTETFILDFDNKVITAKGEGKVFNSGTFPIRNIKIEREKYEGGLTSKVYFFDNDIASLNLLEIFENEEDTDMLILHIYDEFKNRYGYSFEGKATKLKK